MKLSSDNLARAPTGGCFVDLLFNFATCPVGMALEC
jgi:hypothetical protein